MFSYEVKTNFPGVTFQVAAETSDDAVDTAEAVLRDLVVKGVRELKPL